MKAALVERFNRTLQSKLYKYFTAKKTLHYLRVLPVVIKSYNNRIHRAHGVSPQTVNKRNQKKIWEKLYGKYFKKKYKNPKLKIGDLVRLSKLRKTFGKAYLKGWTDEVFSIHEVKYTRPITYTIIDSSGDILKGSFYETELNKIRL